VSMQRNINPFVVAKEATKRFICGVKSIMTVDREELWSSVHEAVLKRYGEICIVFSHLHTLCHLRYKKRNTHFTLPVIVMSTLTGTASMALGSVRDNNAKELLPLVIGSVNLFSAILTTVSQFLKIGELMESHRAAGISYGKLHRQIRLELSLERGERSSSGSEMVKLVDLTVGRLIESGPLISRTVMKEFMKDPSVDLAKLNLPDSMKIQPITPLQHAEHTKKSVYESISTLLGQGAPPPAPPSTPADSDSDVEGGDGGGDEDPELELARTEPKISNFTV